MIRTSLSISPFGGLACEALLLILTTTLTGCIPTHRESTPKGYFGPTDPMAKVVAQINANNQRIPTLWARMHYWELDIVHDGKHDFVNGDGGTIQFRKPGELRVTARRPGSLILDTGTNPDIFWVMAPSPGPDELWWGQYKNLGSPCAQEMPIRPDLLIEVLGISDFDTNFLQPPFPTMRFNNDADAYMFTWHTRSTSPPARWVTQKEVWYDRKTKRPTLVLLFDEDGRIVLRAYLLQHKPVEGSENNSAVIATEYKLRFPQTGSTFWFQLEDVALEYKNAPNDRSFRFDPDNAETHKKHKIDENCAP